MLGWLTYTVSLGGMKKNTKGKESDLEMRLGRHTMSLSDKVSVTNWRQNRMEHRINSKMNLLLLATNPQKGTACKVTGLFLQSHENKNATEPQCLGLKATKRDMTTKQNRILNWTLEATEGILETTLLS